MVIYTVKDLQAFTFEGKIHFYKGNPWQIDPIKQASIVCDECVLLENSLNSNTKLP